MRWPTFRDYTVWSQNQSESTELRDLGCLCIDAKRLVTDCPIHKDEPSQPSALDELEAVIGGYADAGYSIGQSGIDELLALVRRAREEAG